MTIDILDQFRAWRYRLESVLHYDDVDVVLSLSKERISFNITAKDNFSKDYYDKTRLNLWETVYPEKISEAIATISAQVYAADTRKVRELIHAQDQIAKMMENSKEFSDVTQALIMARLEAMREELGSKLIEYKPSLAPTPDPVTDEMEGDLTPPEPPQHYTTLNETKECDAGPQIEGVKEVKE